MIIIGLIKVEFIIIFINNYFLELFYKYSLDSRNVECIYQYYLSQ